MYRWVVDYESVPRSDRNPGMRQYRLAYSVLRMILLEVIPGMTAEECSPVGCCWIPSTLAMRRGATNRCILCTTTGS